MEQYPWFAAECMSKNWNNMPGWTKVGDQGGLYEDRRPYIKEINLARYTSKGVMGGKDFHRTPHYGISPDDVDDYVQLAQENGIPVRKYGRKRWQTSDDVTFVDLSTTDKSDGTVTKLIELVDRLDLPGIFQDYCDGKRGSNTKEDTSRNAHQQNFGFTGGHSLARVDECQLRPQLVGGTTDKEWADRMATMTEIADVVCGDDRSAGFRPADGGLVYNDPHRNKMYANTIHHSNRGEALSCNVTSQERILYIHLDVSNDGTKRGRKDNYHYIFSVWECFVDPSTGRIVRVCLIIYSRKSICDSINRENLCLDFTEEELDPWMKTLPRYRRVLEPGTEIFTKSYFGDDCEVDNDGNVYFPPLLNKHIGHASGFHDGYSQVRSMLVQCWCYFGSPSAHSHCPILYSLTLSGA